MQADRLDGSTLTRMNARWALGLGHFLAIAALPACTEPGARHPPARTADPRAARPPPGSPTPTPTSPPAPSPTTPPAPSPTAPPPAIRIPAQAFEPARRWVMQTNLDTYSYHARHVGNGDGYLAPMIKTRDGGFLVVGTRRAPGKYRVGASRPVVAKLDASGAMQWERDYKASGFLDYEGASAAELADGYVVYILSYVHPARGSVTRLLRLDQSGRKVWDTRLRGEGQAHTPFPQNVRLTGGVLAMDGHIYKDSSETAYGWKGTVDLDGKVLSDEIGGPNPYK